MSHKKKRVAKGLGASALAVATIASGLSFGATTASAAPAEVQSSKTIQIVNQVGNGWNALINWNPRTTQYRTYPTEAGARAAAMTFTVLPVGNDGKRFQLQNGGYCLNTSLFVNYWSTTPVHWSDAFGFAPGSCGGPTSIAVLQANGTALWTSPRYQTVGGNYTTTSYSISGTSSTFYAGPNGVFNPYTVMGAGGNNAPAYFPPNIALPYADLTAGGNFDNDLDKSATVSGTGEPGATVTVKNGDETVATGTIEDDGTYSVELPAPNKAGVLNLTVTQAINGTAAGTANVSLDYGTGVAITSPADQTEAPAGATTIRGTGQDGASVAVAVNGGTPATATVANGQWSVQGTLRNGENKIVATQKSKGANTTTSTVTVNPGASALSEATVTTDEYTPGQRTTFAGTATAGATVDILDADGQQIVRGVQVGTNGAFSFDYTPAAGSTEFVFQVRQTMGSDTRTDGPFTIDAKADAFSPVTVSRPSTVTPGVENVFSGTATPGATYRVLNASGTQIVPGTLTIDADGNWSFSRMVSNGATKFDFVFEQTKNGETRKSQVFSIRANAGMTVTNATRSVRPGVVNTFTGTGPAGASYRVLNMSGTQIVPGMFQIDAQGNWTFDRMVSTNATDFKFKLEITTADGASFTSPLFTVAAQSLTPVTVSTTEVFPGMVTTVTGKGEPNATFSVLNMSDTVLDPSIESTFRVDANGNWEFKRMISNGATNFKFKIKQTLNGRSTTSDLFTIDAATLRPATIDNEYVNAGIWNTFTGTATPGATLRILNNSNNDLGVTDLTIDASGKFSFKRVVSGTASKLDFKIEQTKDGKTVIGDLLSLQARTADVTVDNTTVTPGRVNTFTGTALAGATFKVLTPSNTGDTVLAQGTVADNGRFSFDRTVGTGASSFAFKLVLTKDGKESVSKAFTIPASTR